MAYDRNHRYDEPSHFVKKFNKQPVPSNTLRNFISILITKLTHSGWITAIINTTKGLQVNSVSHTGIRKVKGPFNIRLATYTVNSSFHFGW